MSALLATALVFALLIPSHAGAEQGFSRARTTFSNRMDAGANHTCAISGEGTLRCWGSGESGQLGYGNTKNIGDDEVPSSVAAVDLGAGRTAVSVSAGLNHTCAILDSGTVKCWGANASGQLGYGNTTTIGDNETPAAVGAVNLGAGRTAVAVAVGGSFTCAILDNGTVKCWGANASGQLGYGNTTTIGDNELPSAVGTVDLGAGRSAVAITAGLSFACAILDDGASRCWGANASGQLGYGNTTTVGDNEAPGSVSPVNFGSGRTAVAISAGGMHACAILDNGTMKCWGNGASGRLGYGNTTTVLGPSSVGPVSLGSGRSAIGLTGGEAHTCAILDNGTLKCWGANASGQLGYGNTTAIGDNETPSTVGQVEVGSGRSGVTVSAGETHTCALLDDGTLRCWGAAGAGQLGYGNATAIGDNETPGSAGTVSLGGGHGALEVAGGYEHTCALLDDGTVHCWGSSDVGQLGYGSTAGVGSAASAAAVDLGGQGAVEISTGEFTTCALLANGNLYCWGWANSARMPYGNGQNVGDDETPFSVGPANLGAIRAKAVASDAAHTCVLLVDGTAKCWGWGGSGRLGYGNTEAIGDNETPAAVGTVSVGGSVVGIGAGYMHTCASLTDGTVRCWGYNAYGQLGYGNITAIGDDELPSSAGPVSVGGTVAAVAPGMWNSCVLLGNHSIRCWGDAAYGQLGYGNTTNIGDNELPSTVGPVDFGGQNALALSSGRSSSCVIVTNGTVRCWGLNSSGQLGYGNTNNIGDNETPGAGGPVDLGGESVLDISMGGNHACAVMTNGKIRCWGANTRLQLGYGTGEPVGDNETPGSVPAMDLYDNPPVAVNDAATLVEDAAATAVNVLANDTDVDGGPKEVAAKTNGTHGTVAITGGGTGLTYAPESNYCGPDSFTYTLNGGSQATVSVTVTCVDDPPVAVNDGGSVSEDASAQVIDVLANDTDVDGGPKEITTKTNGAHGAVAIVGGSAAVTYMPAANYCGPDSFTYTLNGGSTATVSVTITCVDDPPVAVNDTRTLEEDSGPIEIEVLSNDTDIDGGPKEVIAKTNGTHGVVAIVGSGSAVTYDPESNYCGPDSFTYELNGGSKATVSVTVACVSDPPVAVNDSKTLEEDAGTTSIDVLANDTDIDGGPKEVVAKTNGSHGTVAITAEGTLLTYTPAANYCGPDSFSYELNGGSTATVSVTVTCVDDAPAAVNDSEAVPEDAPATAIDVLANDSDIDGGPMQVIAKTNGAHGSVAITGGGSGLTYTPVPNYCGEDSFTYTLNGGSQATVSITVSCIDDPPTALSDSATVSEDAPATAIDVLGNDSDIDGGPKQVASKTDGAHGTVAITGGGSGLTYTPAPDYCGPDFFTYVLNGGSQATVVITVSCVDDPPMAVADAETVMQDSPPQAIDVLANDGDIDGGPKVVVGKTNGAHGSVALLGAGAGLTYAPEGGYCGDDSFTYTLNGGSQATVSMTVSCVKASSPTDGSASGSGSSSTTNITAASTGPVVKVTPGVGVLSGRRRPRIAIKGTYAFFTLTCTRKQSDCAGNVKVIATVPAVALGATMKKVVLVHGKFRIGAGRSVLVRARLTRHGLEALEAKRTLRGVSTKMAIEDTRNHERGSIQVNLVRRPKASLLPEPKRPSRKEAGR